MLPNFALNNNSNAKKHARDYSRWLKWTGWMVLYESLIFGFVWLVWYGYADQSKHTEYRDDSYNWGKTPTTAFKRHQIMCIAYDFCYVQITVARATRTKCLNARERASNTSIGAERNVWRNEMNKKIKKKSRIWCACNLLLFVLLHCRFVRFCFFRCCCFFFITQIVCGQSTFGVPFFFVRSGIDCNCFFSLDRNSKRAAGIWRIQSWSNMKIKKWRYY